MNGNRWVAVLIGFAPFLYVAGVSFLDLPMDEVPAVLATFLASIALGLYYLWSPRAGAIVAMVGFATLALVLLVTADAPTTLGSFGDEVTFGALVAAPVADLLIFAQPDRGPGSRLVGLQLAFLDALVLLAARQSVMGSAGSASTPSLVTAYLGAIHTQMTSMVTLISGGGAGPLPLAAVNDPTFIALAGLALLATGYTIVRPQTGRNVELPMVPKGSTEPPADAGEIPGLSVSFRKVLRECSVPEGPPSGVVPELPVLAAVVVTTLVFLAVVYSLASWVFLLTDLGTAAAVGVVVAIVSRPIRPTSVPPEPESSRRSRPLFRTRNPEN